MSSGGLTTPWQLKSTVTSKSPLRSAFVERPGRHHFLRHLEPDLAPFVDDPGGNVFVGLIDVAVQQLESEPLGAGFLQQPLRLGARLLDIGPDSRAASAVPPWSRRAANPETRCRRPCAPWRSWRAPARPSTGRAPAPARGGPAVVERLFLVVRRDQVDAVPVAFLHRDLVAELLDQLVAGRGRQAANSVGGAVGADRVDAGRLLRRVDARQNRRDTAAPVCSSRDCARP